MRAATLYSGGGLADIGIEEAGGEIIFGIDFHEKYGGRIAEWNSKQTGNDVWGKDILSVDPRDCPPVDYLHMSPPCPSFSVANQQKGETEQDIALAKKNVEFIEVLRPKIVTVENVWGYVRSESYRMLAEVLNKYYFMGWDANHLDAADFGVPQNRKRLIVRAIAGAPLPALPKPEPWCGWFQAIEDLIPNLEEGDFAPWQKDRLRDTEYAFVVNNDVRYGDSKAYLVEGVPKGKRPPTVVPSENPVTTIASGSGGRVDRIFLMPGGNETSKVIRDKDEPSNTVRAGRTDPARVYDRGRVVLADARCLARFQTLPDWYDLPKGKSFATTIVGNGFPTLWAKKIAQQLIDQFKE